jgi:hypothetical protein
VRRKEEGMKYGEVNLVKITCKTLSPNGRIGRGGNERAAARKSESAIPAYAGGGRTDRCCRACSLVS